MPGLGVARCGTWAGWLRGSVCGRAWLTLVVLLAARGVDLAGVIGVGGATPAQPRAEHTTRRDQTPRTRVTRSPPRTARQPRQSAIDRGRTGTWSHRPPRRRTGQRRPGDRHLLTSRTMPKRGRVRRAGRRQPSRSQQRPHNPPPPQPRKRPRPQPRTPHHRAHPHTQLPDHTRLRRQTHRRGQDTTRNPTLPQAIHRPTALPNPHHHHDHLTNCETARVAWWSLSG
jgi:hypothetical protein